MENRQNAGGHHQVLGDHGIDLIALSILRIPRILVSCAAFINKPGTGAQLLQEAGFTVSTTEVLAVEVPDVPGSLAKVLQILDQSGISVEYLYSFVRSHTDHALIPFSGWRTTNCA